MITDRNRDYLRAVIEQSGWDEVFDRGHIRVPDPDPELNVLIDSYQAANNALMKYIRR